MSFNRSVLLPFQIYEQARATFAKSIADLAQRSENIMVLNSAGVMPLLRSLLLDPVQSIQTSAALAIGRLANFSESIAESVVQNDIISQLIYSLSNQNRFYKKSSCYVLRAVAKHSAQLAEDIVRSGALPPLIHNLSDLDYQVKEAAAWSLGYIAKHNKELASQVVEAGAIENLILCLQEPEVSLKRAVVQTLSYISDHSDELAEKIAHAGIDIISHYLNYNDNQLRRNICLLLGNIAKHSLDLSLLVWNSLKDPKILLGSLMDPDQIIKRNTAFCICEIVNKDQQNAQKFVDIHGLGVLVDFIANVRGEPRRYGINALGFIAAHDEKLAEAAIDAQAVTYLKDALESETSPEIKGAACYALGQIGKHAPKHAGKVAEQQVLGLMLYNVNITREGDDLNKKARTALQKIILNCRDLKTLEPLIKIAPPDILCDILEQFRKYLKDDKDFKRDFVSGGLKYLQELKCDKNCTKEVSDAIDRINENFSQEVINMYSPSYGEKLISDWEKQNPVD
jgi:HEAT repeat protein